MLAVALVSLGAFAQGASAEVYTEPSAATIEGGDLLFAADYPGYGRELWRTDGTKNGTQPVIDLVQGEASSAPRNFVSLGKRVVFVASNGNGGGPGDQLWISDGSAAGTRRLTDVPNGIPYDIREFRGDVYFTAGDEVGYRLWRSDGTRGGTGLFRNIGLAEHFRPFGKQLLFSANDGVHGTELWRTDGTKGGTRMLKDIAPDGSGLPRDFARLGASLVFAAEDSSHGRELWKTDGTKSGTQLVKDIDPGPDDSLVTDPASLGKRVLFSAQVDGDYEPWRTNGTKSGTKRVKNINTEESSSPYLLTTFDDQVFFGAAPYLGFPQLWRSDGFGRHTYDLGADALSPSTLTAFGDHLLFGAFGTLDFDRELWISGGRPGNTRQLKELNPSDSSNPRDFYRVGKRVVFAAEDADGYELFVTDFTSSGTHQLKDIFPGPTASFALISN